jgi:transposase
MTERRTFSAEFKAKVVLEMIRGEKGLMQASREYQIKDTVLSRWKQEFLERAPELFKGENQHQDSEGNNQRIEELERMVGKMTMELDVAKKVLNGTSLVSPGRKHS